MTSKVMNKFGYQNFIQPEIGVEDTFARRKRAGDDVSTWPYYVRPSVVTGLLEERAGSCV